MRHTIDVSGYLFRLRPVRLEDAAFIVELRTDPQRNAFIHYTAPDIAKQENWLRSYFEAPDDYYFIIEDELTGKREGTIGIHNYRAEENCAEWGRWVIRRGSKSGIPSMFLIFKVAFERLGLKYLFTHTVAENRTAIMILERFGMKERRRLPEHIRIGDRTYEAVEHQITRTDWESMFRLRSSQAGVS
jgi:RimJ/RimL family protein N-acetyltransferase